MVWRTDVIKDKSEMMDLFAEIEDAWSNTDELEERDRKSCNRHFAQWLKWYVDKESKKMECAKNMLQTCFLDFSYRRQVKVLKTFLDGNCEDRRFACQQLVERWNKRFLSKILSLWYEYHEQCAGLLVVRFAPLRVVESEYQNLSKVVTYYDLAMRLAKNKKIIVDWHRMNMIDYFEVLIANHRPINMNMDDFDRTLRLYATLTRNVLCDSYVFLSSYQILTNQKKLKHILWIMDTYREDKSVNAVCDELVYWRNQSWDEKDYSHECQADMRSKSKMIDAVFDKFHEWYLWLVGRLSIEDLYERYGKWDEIKSEKPNTISVQGDKRMEVDGFLRQSNSKISRLMDGLGLEAEGVVEKKESCIDQYFHPIPQKRPFFLFLSW
jgi:hypothetical protein